MVGVRIYTDDELTILKEQADKEWEEFQASQRKKYF